MGSRKEAQRTNSQKNVEESSLINQTPHLEINTVSSRRAYPLPLANAPSQLIFQISPPISWSLPPRGSAYVINRTLILTSNAWWADLGERVAFPRGKGSTFQRKHLTAAGLDSILHADASFWTVKFHIPFRVMPLRSEVKIIRLEIPHRFLLYETGWGATPSVLEEVIFYIQHFCTTV